VPAVVGQTGSNIATGYLQFSASEAACTTSSSNGVLNLEFIIVTWPHKTPGTSQAQ
jgi:hypothetical protein